MNPDPAIRHRGAWCRPGSAPTANPPRLPARARARLPPASGRARRHRAGLTSGACTLETLPGTGSFQHTTARGPCCLNATSRQPVTAPSPPSAACSRPPGGSGSCRPRTTTAPPTCLPCAARRCAGGRASSTASYAPSSEGSPGTSAPPCALGRRPACAALRGRAPASGGGGARPG